MIELTLINRSGRSVPHTFLKAWVKALSRLASRRIAAKRFTGRSLVIAFVSSKEMRALNKQFRGRDKPTDVLSFEGADDSELGELAISPEVIVRQAREHGLLVREELGYMVLHGFLHLLGYDHEIDERGAKEMFALQDELFEELLEVTSKPKPVRKPKAKSRT